MDTSTFRDVVQIVPTLAIAACSQVAAAALTQAARFLDESGSTATLLTRAATRNATYLSADLSTVVAEQAHVYASRTAYQAQRQAERLGQLTDSLAAALETTVETTTHRAQRAAHRQAHRAAAFADDQAVAASYALQSLVGHLPGFVGRDGSADFDPWVDIPPPHRNSAGQAPSASAAAAAPAAQPAPASTSSSSSTATPVCPAAAGQGAPPHAQQQSAARTARPNSAHLTTSTSPEPALTVRLHDTAALEDAQVRLAVKQLTADIFRTVERAAAADQLARLSQQLQRSQAELQAARLQLEAATSTVAALPQQMVLMVQNQMRRAMREGMVELMREALASPEPDMMMPAGAGAGWEADAFGAEHVAARSGAYGGAAAGSSAYAATGATGAEGAVTAVQEEVIEEQAGAFQLGPELGLEAFPGPAAGAGAAAEQGSGGGSAAASVDGSDEGRSSDDERGFVIV